MVGTFNVVDTNFGGAWRMLLAAIMGSGDVVSPRGIATEELVNVTMRVTNLRANILVDPVRDPNYRFMVAEWLWIWFGEDDVAPLARYVKRMNDFSDDGKTLAGAYGPRLAPQWTWLLDKLRDDPGTREAVLSIWRPAPAPSKDIPCTLTFQFLIRKGLLHLIVNMRSSDVWLGLPYDFFTFSQLANVVASQLQIPTGELIMNLGSSHLYAQHSAAAERVIHHSTTKTLISPALDEPPPVELRHQLLTGVLERWPDSWGADAIWEAYSCALNADNNDTARMMLPKEDSDAGVA